MKPDLEYSDPSDQMMLVTGSTTTVSRGSGGTAGGLGVVDNDGKVPLLRSKLC